MDEPSIMTSPSNYESYSYSEPASSLVKRFNTWYSKLEDDVILPDPYDVPYHYRWAGNDSSDITYQDSYSNDRDLAYCSKSDNHTCAESENDEGIDRKLNRHRPRTGLMCESEEISYINRPKNGRFYPCTALNLKRMYFCSHRAEERRGVLFYEPNIVRYIGLVKKIAKGLEPGSVASDASYGGHFLSRYVTDVRTAQALGRSFIGRHNTKMVDAAVEKVRSNGKGCPLWHMAKTSQPLPVGFLLLDIFAYDSTHHSEFGDDICIVNVKSTDDVFPVGDNACTDPCNLSCEGFDEDAKIMDKMPLETTRKLHSLTEILDQLSKDIKLGTTPPFVGIPHNRRPREILLPTRWNKHSINKPLGYLTYYGRLSAFNGNDWPTMMKQGHLLCRDVHPILMPKRRVTPPWEGSLLYIWMMVYFTPMSQSTFERVLARKKVGRQKIDNPEDISQQAKTEFLVFANLCGLSVWNKGVSKSVISKLHAIQLLEEELYRHKLYRNMLQRRCRYLKQRVLHLNNADSDTYVPSHMRSALYNYYYSNNKRETPDTRFLPSSDETNVGDNKIVPRFPLCPSILPCYSTICIAEPEDSVLLKYRLKKNVRPPLQPRAEDNKRQYSKTGDRK